MASDHWLWPVESVVLKHIVLPVQMSARVFFQMQRARQNGLARSVILAIRYTEFVSDSSNSR